MAIISQNPKVNQRIQNLLQVKDTALSIVPLTPEQRLVVNDDVFNSYDVAILTPYTTLARPQQFYLSAISISGVNAAGAATDLIAVSGPINGNTSDSTLAFFQVPAALAAGAAEATNIFLPFPKPIAITPGGAITQSQTGTSTFYSVLYGFYEKVST